MYFFHIFIFAYITTPLTLLKPRLALVPFMRYRLILLNMTAYPKSRPSHCFKPKMSEPL